MERFTFDADKHEYRFDGERIPSVTQVLCSLYELGAIPPWVLERKRQIGQAVHAATEILDRGEALDPATIDPAIEGYLKAHSRFIAECGPEFRAIEIKAYHHHRKYAGTIDRVAMLNGEYCCLDYKCTASISDAVGIQLAAYTELLREDHLLSLPGRPPKISRVAVQFKPYGTYRLHCYTDPHDLTAWWGLLAINNWKQRHDY